MITNKIVLYLFFILMASALSFFQGLHCGKGRTTTASPCDTVTKTDTVYNSRPKDSTPLHLPTLAETKKATVAPYKHQIPPITDTQALSVGWVSAESYAYLVGLYKAVERERDSLWEAHYAAHYWRDSAHFASGSVTFSGVTQENKLHNVRLGIAPAPLPVVTKTVTLKEPAKNKAYVGVYTAYRPYDASAAMGATFLFIQKRGMGLQLHGGFNTRGEGEYGLGAHYPIRLRRSIP